MLHGPAIFSFGAYQALSHLKRSSMSVVAGNTQIGLESALRLSYSYGRDQAPRRSPDMDHTEACTSAKVEMSPEYYMKSHATETASHGVQNERVLFHYNGHGVPRPTANGEIWVFNKSYTQYIPMSVYDLQAWVGSPAIYVFDCSAAGLIINSFKAFAEQRTQVRLASAASAGVVSCEVHRDKASPMADVWTVAMLRHVGPQGGYFVSE